MNTCVWGPAVWAVLHGTAPYVPAKAAGVVHDFVHLLQRELPCKYCRASFAEFLTEAPPVTEAVQAGTYPQWLFDMHNRVNNKLLRQRFQASGVVPESGYDAAVAAMLPDREAIRKRIRATCPYFSDAQVQTALGIIALNATDDVRRDDFVKFVLLLSHILCLSRQHVDVARALFAGIPTLTSATDETQLCAAVGSLLKIPSGIAETPEEFVARMAVAKAGACAHGVCK